MPNERAPHSCSKLADLLWPPRVCVVRWGPVYVASVGDAAGDRLLIKLQCATAAHSGIDAWSLKALCALLAPHRLSELSDLLVRGRGCVLSHVQRSQWLTWKLARPLPSTLTPLHVFRTTNTKPLLVLEFRTRARPSWRPMSVPRP